MSELGTVYQKLTTTDVRYGYQFNVNIIGAEGLNDLRFYATSTTKPAMTINTGEINYQGFTFRVPNNLTFDGTWSVTVRASQDMTLYDAFIKWSKIYADFSKGGGGSKIIPNSNATIDLMDQELNSVKKTYTMYGIFPTEIGELSVAHDDTAVMTFTVNFAYQYWE